MRFLQPLFALAFLVAIISHHLFAAAAAKVECMARTKSGGFCQNKTDGGPCHLHGGAPKIPPRPSTTTSTTTTTTTTTIPSFNVTSVTNGVVVTLDKNGGTVRLAGMSADNSANALIMEMTKGRPLNVRPDGRSEGGLPLVYLFDGAKNINLELVRAGHARAAPNAPKPMLDAEEQAKRAKAGRWAER